MKIVSNNTNPDFDQVDELQSAFAGFADLLCPDPTIGPLQRDHIACLFDFLMDEQNKRIEKLHKAVIAQKEPRHG